MTESTDTATMTASVEHVDREVVVGLAVADGPVLKKQYGQRHFRVDRVDLRYQRSDDEPWQISGVDLGGPYVLKSGKDGADRNRDHYWSSTDWSAIPWLLALVEMHMPAEAAR